MCGQGGQAVGSYAVHGLSSGIAKRCVQHSYSPRSPALPERTTILRSNNCVVSPQWLHWGALDLEAMMKYAILRVQKLKHAVSVRRSIEHAIRARETPNANPELTSENSADFRTVGEATARFNDRLATQQKIRKNAVLAVEYLVAGSPEAIHGKTREEQDAYFRDALKWIEQRHGKQNVIASGIHRDETTPHMYAIVVPIDRGGKLNCRSFLGGAKALSQMQSEFAAEVGQPHGLERGIEGSKARHTTIRQYYARVNRPYRKAPVVELPEPKLLEGKRDYGERVQKSTIEQLKDEILQGRVAAQEIELERAERANLNKQVIYLTELAKPLRKALATLNHDEQGLLIKQIDDFTAAKEKQNADRDRDRVNKLLLAQIQTREREAARAAQQEAQPKQKPKTQAREQDHDNDLGM